MDTHTSFLDLLPRSKARTTLAKTVKVGDHVASVKSGRQSVAEGSEQFQGYMERMMKLKPDFKLEVLSAIEHLAMYHSDVSYAVDNIVSLSNTPFQVYFLDTVSDEQAKEMKLHLKRRSKDWYAHSGGLNSMVNDLLAQASIFGALSAESIPNDDLTGVKKNVLVSPKNIRFRYDIKGSKYIPIQVGQGTGNSPSQDIELNETTYKYISLRRFNEKPYAVPPFLSALYSVSTGLEMSESMKSVMKNLGVLGFLEVLVNAPKPLPQEDEDTYYERSKSYLTKVIPEIENGINRGFVTGFKGLHSFEMKSTTNGAEGASQLVDINDQKTFAGLKQDGLMFGRTFSTTETLGRVILAKMTTQAANYQRVIATYLENLFLLELSLFGFDVEDVSVEFEPPMIGDKDKEVTARGKEIDNTQKLYSAGIISQQQRAVELGYEKPDQEEPRPALIDPNKPIEDVKGDGKTDPAKEKKVATKNEIAGIALGAGRIEYPYETQACGCAVNNFEKMLLSRERLPLAGTPDSLDDFIRMYFDATLTNYSGAIKKVTYKIGQALLDVGQGASLQQVQDAIYYHLYTNWNGAFSVPQSRVINRFVKEAYEYFRSSKKVFSGVGKTPPKSTFSVIDQRAIDYYKRSDSFYLGKFITDESMKNKLSAHIREEYLNRRLPIGGDKAAIKAFREKLGSTMHLEDWKISQIIDTTVSRLRSVAAVHYYQQAEIEEFEIRGVNDNRQCDYCDGLQGKKFSVERTVTRLSDTHQSDPTMVKADMPFITTLYKDPADVKRMSGKDLQDNGFDLVPAHPRCRDTVVPVI